jgi:hypothetical protein
MKIHFITYGDDKYSKSKQRIKAEAEDFGLFDNITVYEPKLLTNLFKQVFKDVLSLERGGGYWIWKIDIILQELSKMQEGDIVVYLDSGCTINKNGEQRFKEYINLLNRSEHNSIGFVLPCLEKQWTTKELYNAFEMKEDNTGQILGGCMIYKKNKKLLEMFEEILKVLQKDPFLITDKYNGQGQKSYFIDNRHDQSVFSLMRKKYKSIVLPNEIDNNAKIDKFPFWATRILE